MRAWSLCPRAFRQSYPVMVSFAHVEACASGDFVHGRSPQARACRGTCEWPWPLCPRAFRSPVMLSFAHVEASASDDFVHGRSLQARACRGTCEWRLRPWAEASRIAPALTSGRSPETSRKHPAQAVYRLTFCSSTSAYVATLSTSSWTAPPRIHAPSIWISARFVGLRCEHAVCTMRLSFMRYTMAGEEPRALRPVP